MKNTSQLSPKIFINRILSGTALGILIGLIPNAVLAGFLKFFENPLALKIIHISTIFQIATPLLVGALIALQFNLKPLQMMVTAGACFVASGVVRFNPESKVYVGAGIGDLINTMITAAIVIGVLLLVKDRFGSVSIIAIPIVIGIGGSFIGVTLLPLVSKVTTTIGIAINTFTDLQPIIMSMLIACSFAILIITPISTIAIGLAIQLNGLSAGASAMGVAATTMVLIIHSWKVNKSGVTIAIALGGMKMMMPNLFRHPIILLPCLTTAAISAIPISLFSVTGTPQSSGFGLVGLVGPLASMNGGLSLVTAILVWIIIPIVAGLASYVVYEKVLHLYHSRHVFKFQENN